MVQLFYRMAGGPLLRIAFLILVMMGFCSVADAQEKSELENQAWPWSERVNYRPRILPIGAWAYEFSAGSESVDLQKEQYATGRIVHGVSDAAELFSTYRYDFSSETRFGRVGVGMALEMSQSDDMQFDPEFSIAYDLDRGTLLGTIRVRLVYRWLKSFCIFSDDRLEIDLQDGEATYIVPVLLGYQVSRSWWLGMDTELFRFPLRSDEPASLKAMEKLGLQFRYSYQGKFDVGAGVSAEEASDSSANDVFTMMAFLSFFSF